MNEICFLHINLKVWKFQKTMLKRKKFFDRFSPPFSHFLVLKCKHTVILSHSNIQLDKENLFWKN